MAKISIAAAIVLLLMIGLIVLSVLRQAGVTCEVCITFNGRTQCRTAQGATREEAIRTATDNACAFLAAGMTDGIRCSNTPPDSVSCDEP